ncbi:MAG: nucleotidyltransferase family protein [Chthoniobacterales bacterium]
MRSVGALILAAGGSTRFGQPKQLLRLEGETLVHRAVRAASEGDCAPVIVVAGTIASEIAADLRGTAAEVVQNDDWSRGLGTSIRCGVQHLVRCSPTSDAVLLLACDQPFVDAALISAILAERVLTGREIVASRYADTLGVPALFGRSCFAALLSLPNESGAKGIIEADPSRVGAVPFPKGAIDLDTPADLAQLGSTGKSNSRETFAEWPGKFRRARGLFASPPPRRRAADWPLSSSGVPIDYEP